MPSDKPLRIVHCFRTPVGGVFRHVRDLIKAQSANGHDVGIICDSTTGGDYADKLFEEIKSDLSLGLQRIPMRRSITPGDISTVWKTYKKIKQLKPDVLHSHGAKGGAYARIIGSLLRVSGIRVARLYCPHGGSIHFDAASMKGKVFFGLERLLNRMTDRLIFVSQYESDEFQKKVGKPSCATSLIYNGLSPHEYLPVKAEKEGADFLYIGEMRDLKGPDVFLNAISKIKSMPGHADIKAVFVGSGPDKSKYIEQIATLELGDCVDVYEAMPAREAFAKAAIVVIPSLAESMPYIVLEAIAGHMPIVATRVGGVPEIFDGEPDAMCEPGNPDALAAQMLLVLNDKQRKAKAGKRSKKLAERFSVDVMANDVETAYLKTLQSI